MEASRKKDLGFLGSLAEARRTTERKKSSRVMIAASIKFRYRELSRSDGPFKCSRTNRHQLIQPQGFWRVDAFVFATFCLAMSHGGTGCLLTACKIFASE